MYERYTIAQQPAFKFKSGLPACLPAFLIHQHMDASDKTSRRCSKGEMSACLLACLPSLVFCVCAKRFTGALCTSIETVHVQ